MMFVKLNYFLFLKGTESMNTPALVEIVYLLFLLLTVIIHIWLISLLKRWKKQASFNLFQVCWVLSSSISLSTPYSWGRELHQLHAIISPCPWWMYFLRPPWNKSFKLLLHILRTYWLIQAKNHWYHRPFWWNQKWREMPPTSSLEDPCSRQKNHRYQAMYRGNGDSLRKMP